MIIFSDFTDGKGSEDELVGISIAPMITQPGLNAYGTTLKMGKRVGCHSHAEGEEWYIILSGEGEIWTADVVDNSLKDRRIDQVSKGSVFCIYPYTAHQLLAKTDIELIFLCPESHITTDRTLFADLIN
ncbi:hypothetical protein [Winslowiella iniecta]|uniref:Cupin 2 conserved barrel domain-containing protein n=1 Tax=Winslowiella iniecta TaxID=1560201 RepID=A0A0L7SZ41_9GAMM|nr:hypothetical protein [Winslowiella iniecta]KOC88439.1 hypothetical protein NG42_16215 [Winslowiella iniecta]KOC91711.1 hypothetical protein NG43_15315 [Winslowiella iniecta]